MYSGIFNFTFHKGWIGRYRPGGADPHVLDMAPIYQEAYATLLRVKDTPRLVATRQVKLLPSYPQFYPSGRYEFANRDFMVTKGIEITHCDFV